MFLRFRTHALALNALALMVAGCQNGFQTLGQASHIDSPLHAVASVATAGAPLVVDENSSVVVMQYEPWFGPRTGAANSPGNPLLRSSNMSTGYDSMDPAVISTHVQQLEALNVDVLMVDISNGALCIYSHELSDCAPNPTEAYRTALRDIKDRAANLYPALAAQSKMKIIPLLGGDTAELLRADSTGRMILLQQFDFWIALQQRFPQMNVIYEGKPLITIYLGPAQDDSTDALWKKIRTIFQQNYGNVATLRLEAGLISDQPGLWKNPSEGNVLHEEKPATPFWSWRERYKPSMNLLPGYLRSAVNGRAENFVVSIATPGNGVLYNSDPSGVGAWGNPKTGQYDPYASTRRGGATLTEMMDLAVQVRPQFLFINEWNNFSTSQDSGFDAETMDEIEPNSAYGTQAYDQLKQELIRYRAALTMPAAGFLLMNSGTVVIWNGTSAVCTISSIEHYKYLGGDKEIGTLARIADIPAGIRNDGPCNFNIPAGFYFLNGGVFISNGAGHVCGINSPAEYTADGGTKPVSELPVLPFIPSNVQNDGNCNKSTPQPQVTQPQVTQPQVTQPPAATPPPTTTPVPPPAINTVPPTAAPLETKTVYRFWKAYKDADGKDQHDRLSTETEKEGYDAGYTKELSSFQFYKNDGPGMRAIYRCNAFAAGHFFSVDPQCEGFTTDYILGYLKTTPDAGTRPIYRLWSNVTGEHLMSYDQYEGAAVGFSKEKDELGFGPL